MAPHPLPTDVQETSTAAAGAGTEPMRDTEPMRALADQIRADSRQETDRYLEESVVPFGGE